MFQISCFFYCLGRVIEPVQVRGALKHFVTYDGVSISFRTGLLEQELQIVQFSATRSSCIAILLVSVMSFAAISLYVASQRVFIVTVVYFFMNSVRKLLDTPSYYFLRRGVVRRNWILGLGREGCIYELL
jgi:hypothetical protein